MADYTVFSNVVLLRLSYAEAEALRACANEGAEGLLNDKAAAKAYVGGTAQQNAARRALEALGSACVDVRKNRKAMGE